MKYILFLIGIFCYPFILKAQWSPVYVPTYQGLETIAFTDTLHGFITVADGSILETSNEGINWQTVLTGSGNNELYDICFPTASTGYSVGDNGHIVKTTNAGGSWPLINSPTTNMLRGVFFLNTDTGFICGQQESIYKTSNRGATWIQQTSGAYWLRKFSFPTQQTGYCAGDNHLVFKTTDGGMTWNQLPGSGGLNINGIQFLTVDTGYVCGASGYVAKSFNGGLTWQVLTAGTTKNFSGLWFFNSQIGYCVGDSGLIMKTTNGGATWTKETSGTSFSLYHLYFLHQYQGFICGDVGTLLENCLSSPGSITGPSHVCRGDTGKIYLANTVVGATGYHWSVPPGVIITSGNNTNIITVTYTATSVSGSFSVYAYKTNCNGESSPDFTIVVNSVPVVEAGPDQSIPYDSITTLAGNITGGSGSYSYYWEPFALLNSDTLLDPRTMKLIHDTLFILYATDLLSGCKSSDSVRIKIIKHEINEDCLVFYNVITPNGDGVNDKWIIDCIENFPDNKVIIFNRWGDQVSTINNYNNISQVWNGNSADGHPLPDGTYYYVLTIKNGRNHCGWIFLRGIE
jgi:gliding motility-associated-like protein